MGYHINNILLHSLNAILVMWVLKKLGLKAFVAAAFIFALHPVHVESVAWISERKNVLSGFFFLSSLLCFLEFDDSKNRWGYYASLCLYMAALLSKTITCSLPAVLILIHWMKEGRVRARFMANLIPYFILGFWMGLLTINFEKAVAGAQGTPWHLTWAQHFILPGKILWFYVSKLLWPTDLTFIYPKWTLDTGKIVNWIPSISFIAAVIAAWKYEKKLSRGPLASLLIFSCILFPALGFFNVYPFLFSYVADHFQYLASIAAVALVCEAFAHWAPPAARFIPFILLPILGFRASAQCKIYKDAETLWMDTIQKNPHAAIGYNNLIALHANNSNLDEALRLEKISSSLFPNDPMQRFQSAELFTLSGKLDEAILAYRQSIGLFKKYEPDNPEVLRICTNLGELYEQTGQFEKAIDINRLAIKLNHTYYIAYIDLARLLQKMKKYNESLDVYNRVLAAVPSFPGIHYNIASVYYDQKRYREAEDHMEKELSLDPQNPLIISKLAMLKKLLDKK